MPVGFLIGKEYEIEEGWQDQGGSGPERKTEDVVREKDSVYISDKEEP